MALDTKSREFQYKLLNRCLATNMFFSKISIVASLLCSFCGVMDESLKHIFVSCHYTEKFWAEVIKWLGDHDVNIELLSVKDMLGILVCKDYLFINHMLLLTKRHIYSSRCKKVIPSFRVFTAKIKLVFQLETTIARSENKLPTHLVK